MTTAQEAITMALKVGFLDTREELELYAGAINAAMIWGDNVK